MDHHEPASSNMKARQYTLEDGLAGMLIEDIYQDRRVCSGSPPPTAG